MVRVSSEVKKEPRRPAADRTTGTKERESVLAARTSTGPESAVRVLLVSLFSATRSRSSTTAPRK